MILRAAEQELCTVSNGNGNNKNKKWKCDTTAKGENIHLYPTTLFDYPIINIFSYHRTEISSPHDPLKLSRSNIIS